MDLRDDVKRQLAHHQGQLAVSNPDLYRHLALYLQVLRSGLLTAVQQACFHLATQVEPSRYQELPSRQRQHLHQVLIYLLPLQFCFDSVAIYYLHFYTELY